MSTLSTHVLDTGRGRPAVGVRVVLEAADGSIMAHGTTDEDGRIAGLGGTLAGGTHRLRFDTGRYFAGIDTEAFYPEVVVTFTVASGEHFHVPLLLAAYGYSTYRGS